MKQSEILLVSDMSMRIAGYNSETLWLGFFVLVCALGILALVCYGWWATDRLHALAAKRDEAEKENAWISRLNQDMRQFLITKGLVDEFKAHVYKLYTPVPIPAPNLEDIQKEIQSYIKAADTQEVNTTAEPADGNGVIVLPAEHEPGTNGSAPPPTVLH